MLIELLDISCKREKEVKMRPGFCCCIVAAATACLLLEEQK